ncbi:hypothetical protein D9756_011499 [Leucocoprinus leucothites]|uniref:BTB domain-containing protein n=1 Tax=Leucocoprinus leucothites TaxID=201217 RepID=A0A8H5CQT7_9AGAR|nr:hypothetical protein D9756_011499 [Leucoagaricus leucothites]
MEVIPSCFGPRRRYKTSKLPNNFFVNEPRPSPPSPYDVPLLLRDRESQRASLVPSFLLRGGDIVAPEAYPQDEIFFRSTDGKDVKAKLYRVETNTSGMIPETWTPLDSTVIGLPETAAVLHILFQFINPGNPPDLRGLPFDSLARLTKAAEKYQVFNAMSICSERMRSLSDQYPKQILVYGLHYNYPAIVDETAPHVVTSEKLADIFPLLPLDHHSRWVRYSCCSIFQAHTALSSTSSDITVYGSAHSNKSSLIPSRNKPRNTPALESAGSSAGRSS